MGNIQLSFVYTSGTILNVKRISFKACLNYALTLPASNKIVYVKMEKATTPRKIMLYDETLFRQFLNREMSLPELVNATECEACFRNIMDCQLENQTIDSDSLWVLRDGKYVLVDSDQLVRVSYPDTNFEMI